jgi:hypothetical protein
VPAPTTTEVFSMSSEPQHPDTDPRSAREPTSAGPGEKDAGERADIEEDRRRQRDLDDAELGGEA